MTGVGEPESRADRAPRLTEGRGPGGPAVAALRAEISDPVLRALPLTGAVDQFIDSTDALGNPALLRAAVTAAQSARERPAS